MMTDKNQPTDTSLKMIRDDFMNVPVFSLPDNYRFRTYREGDENTWTDIQLAADPYNDITPELFESEFGDGREVLGDRMLFVETHTGEPAGTITAWREKLRDRSDDRGIIHWVAVLPEHQGKGIAKAMMTRAMSTLAQYHERAILGTSSGRPAAVKIYLDFGFRPDEREAHNPEIVAAWQQLYAHLQHPLIASFLDTQVNSI